MSLDYSFICPLRNGVHARPASALEEVARVFSAEVLLLNQRTGRTANVKSVLSIVATDIRYNDPCLLKISGADEENAMTTLGAFLRDTFPSHDSDLPPVAIAEGELCLPPGLRNDKAVFRRGTPVVPGLAQGRILRACGFSVPEELLATPADPSAEQQVMDNALQELVAWYGERVAAAGKGLERELLAAQRSLARDPEFRRCLLEAIVQRRRSAAGAVAEAEARFSEQFLASGNPLLRERVLDVRDVCGQLLQRVYGTAVARRTPALSEDTLVVADTLTPCEFLALDCRFLKGLVLGEAGTTSHTVILARSFGIPTLTGVERISEGMADKQEAVLDANLGVLVTGLTDETRRYYFMEHQRLEERQKVLRAFSEKPGATADGRRMGIAVNIATEEEASRAFAAGAEAVGLFRTEMLYLDRNSPPGEEEQYAVYRRVVEAADGKPVVIRTLDIGGDKPLPYLKLPLEQNPFLGYRGLRIYSEFEPLFRTQVRALIRASAYGPVELMLPMVAALDEIRWAKKVISEELSALGGKTTLRPLPVGAMVEIPSAAFALKELCGELDFFSIGSNDLLQYFMAVDRANARVARLYDPLQPSFLRLLKHVVETIHAANKRVGLCGEMGAQKEYLPLLVGLGLDEISVSLPAIAGLKAELSQLKSEECRQVLASALACADPGEVSVLLNPFLSRRSAPLLAEELILMDADAGTKEEAIKRAVDLLYIHGRTEQPRAIEEAVWQREATYSTGFGHGFAIPHGKTDAVRAHSLVLLKLRQPVSWGSLDGEPVRVVLLLAVRITGEGAEHMKVISKLARQVMHEEFRSQMEQEKDPATLCRLVLEKLNA